MQPIRCQQISKHCLGDWHKQLANILLRPSLGGLYSILEQNYIYGIRHQRNVNKVTNQTTS